MAGTSPPPAVAAATSEVVLTGASLATLSASAVAVALATALGIAEAAVSASVQRFDASMTVSLSGDASELTAAQLSALASSLADSLHVDASTVLAWPSSTDQQLATPSLQVGITVSGLSDSAAVARTAELMAAPGTLNALLERLDASADINSVAGSAVVLAAHLAVVVQLPAVSQADLVASLLNSAAGNAMLVATLHAAGITVSSVSSATPFRLLPPSAAPVVAGDAPSVAPTAAVVEQGDADQQLSLVIALSVVSTLSCFCAGTVWMRRARGVVQKTCVTATPKPRKRQVPRKAFTSDEEVPPTPSPRLTDALHFVEGRDSLGASPPSPRQSSLLLQPVQTKKSAKSSTK